MKDKAQEFADATPDPKALPEHVGKSKGKASLHGLKAAAKK